MLHLVGSLKGRDHLGDLICFREYNVRVCIKFN